MNPSFWDARYATDEMIFGAVPNAFIEAQAKRLPEGASVIELGTGEGRNAVFLAERGFDVTALDYSTEGLHKTAALAEARGVSLEIIRADVTQWQPKRSWDAVVITFLHLLPEERPALHRLIQHILGPGGRVIAEWFRPEQITEGYSSGGPPRVELMVTPDELRADFPEEGIEMLAATETELVEGRDHQGPAAVVRFVWRNPY